MDVRTEDFLVLLIALPRARSALLTRVMSAVIALPSARQMY